MPLENEIEIHVSISTSNFYGYQIDIACNTHMK